MKIKLLTCLSGDKVFYNSGEIIEVGEDRAKLFIDRGIAEKIAEPKKSAKKAVDEAK